MNHKSCPKCGLPNHVNTVLDVIDANTQYSETHGAVFNWSEDNFVGISTADYATTSSTSLAQKFSLPDNPGKPGIAKLTLYWLIGTIISGFTLAKFEHLGGIDYIFAWFFGVICFAVVLGVPIALIVGAVHLVVGVSASVRWNTYRDILWNSYYCSYCNIAFDNHYLGGPINYTEALFTGKHPLSS